MEKLNKNKVLLVNQDGSKQECYILGSSKIATQNYAIFIEKEELSKEEEQRRIIGAEIAFEDSKWFKFHEVDEISKQRLGILVEIIRADSTKDLDIPEGTNFIVVKNKNEMYEYIKNDKLNKQKDSYDKKNRDEVLGMITKNEIEKMNLKTYITDNNSSFAIVIDGKKPIIFDLNSKEDIESLRELIKYLNLDNSTPKLSVEEFNKVTVFEEPKIEETVVVKEQPKKKHTVAKVLFAGAVLFGLYKGGEYYLQNNNESPTNNGTVPVVDVVFVKEDLITKEEFKDTVIELAASLKKEGYTDVEAKDISALVFVSNIDRFEESTVEELKNDNLIAESSAFILNDAEDLLYKVANSNVMGLINNDASKFYSLTNFIVGEDEFADKDRKIVSELEADIINLKKLTTIKELETSVIEMQDFFAGKYVKGKVYREDLSTGAEYLATRGVGIHLTSVSASIIIDNKLGVNQGTLNAIEASIGDTSELETEINKICGFELAKVKQ